MRARVAALVIAGVASVLAAGCNRAAVPSPAPSPAASPAASPEAAASPAPEPSPAPLPYDARLGREVWRYYCQNCHGETGAGDGFNAFNLDPRPRDVSDSAFQKKKGDADLADAIRRGGAGVGLSALMPPWGKTLSDRQVREVVAYMRTLRRAP